MRENLGKGTTGCGAAQYTVVCDSVQGVISRNVIWCAWVWFGMAVVLVTVYAWCGFEGNGVVKRGMWWDVR
jgi:hypothetical protein